MTNVKPNQICTKVVPQLAFQGFCALLFACLVYACEQLGWRSVLEAATQAEALTRGNVGRSYSYTG